MTLYQHCFNVQITLRCINIVSMFRLHYVVSTLFQCSDYITLFQHLTLCHDVVSTLFQCSDYMTLYQHCFNVQITLRCINIVSMFRLHYVVSTLFQCSDYMTLYQHCFNVQITLRCINIVSMFRLHYVVSTFNTMS